MLDIIRSNTQSLGVKLAFGLIILVFVFWGVGSFTEGDSSRLMAKVNGESILEPQFYKQYNRVAEQLSRQGISREQRKAQHLGRDVLQNMIVRTLVLQEAKRLGLTITPLELRRAIEQNPIFLDKNGKFSSDSYTQGLARIRISAAEFEQTMRDEMLFERMISLVSASTWREPDAAKKRFDYLFEKRTLDYIFIPAAHFVDTQSVSEEECKKYYDSNRESFVVPKKAAISYIVLDPNTIVDPKTISEDDIKNYYEKNKKAYTQREAVRAAHILVPLNEDADEAARAKAMDKIAQIQKELKSGKKFADLANAYNEKGAAEAGGELGWIERGITVEPFEKAAFSQKEGVVSEKPVTTQFGLHLILVHEKRKESVKALQDVANDIRTQIAKDRGRDALSEVGENLLEETLLGKDLAASAQKVGLKAQTAKDLTQKDLIEKFSLSKDDAERILSGIPIDTLLQADKDALIVRVDHIEKERVKPFEEVSKTIVANIKKEKALQEAMTKAAELRKTLQDGPIPAEMQKKLGVERAEGIERNASLPNFSSTPKLIHDAFLAKKDTWLSQVFSARKKDDSAGALIVHITDIQKASTQDWDKIHTFLEQAAEGQTTRQVQTLFIQELFKKAKISNVNYEKTDSYDG